MKNFKTTFSLLGLLLFVLVLISSTVTADEKPKKENKAVAGEATKETNVPDDVGKEGYGGGGGGGGGCGCCKKYVHVCGRQCCYPQNEGTEVVSEAAADANPERYGGGYGHGGGGYGHGGGGYGHGGGGYGGKGGGGWGGGGKGGGGGYGGGGKGGGGWGGGGT